MRAQAHTLEGFVAGFLLLSSLVFALQVTAVTPLSASTSSQHIENQQGATAEGVLAAAVDNGTLVRAITYWDHTEEEFRGTDAREYYSSRSEVDDFAFGRMLTDAFDDRGIAFNVYLIYRTSGENVNRERFIYRGQPSDHAATASALVTLYDDDRLHDDPDGDRVAEPMAIDLAGSSFYAPDASPSTGVYNVVRVEVVAWRM